MLHYNVTLTLQAPDNDPVDISYGKNMTALDTAHSVLQALQMASGGRGTDFEPETLAIRIELVR